jgi:outer membrane protein assembly factor BamA
VRIGLSADSGPQVRLKSVGVRGNTITKKRVVLRETRLKEGAVFSRRDVDAARDNLSRSGLFGGVEEPEIRFAGDEATVTLVVRDGGMNTFDAVAGYNPPQTERDRGYVTGRLEFGFKNLLGTGRLLEVYWEKKNANSQAMRFGYEEPWLLGRPVHPGLRFRQEIRDTLYVEREWRLSVRFTPMARVSAALEAGRREIVIDSLGSALLGLAQTRSWFLSARLDYSTLDEPLNPRQGVRYHTEFMTGTKKNLGPDFLIAEQALKASVFTRTIAADMEAALPVSRRQVFYLGIHGAEIRSGDSYVPLSDQVRFGGSNTVRGYPEDAFRGTLAAWFNAEYRRLLGRYSRAFVFVDGGMAQRREPETGLVKTDKIGYGFGIRLETRLGIVGVDFGLGEGDTFLRGKIHVRLINRF